MRIRTSLLLSAAAAIAMLSVFGTVPASSQADEETQRGLERYREMLREDPWSNPALLDADRGELLWQAAAGPNEVSLEDCDLGLGAGVVDGAFAQMPRYFEDAGRVMDLETRIIWCMEEIQGVNMSEFLSRPHPGGGQPVKEVGAIATWIANMSEGMTYELDHDDDRLMDAVVLGEVLFKRRSGPFDFSCETCHADAGQRIRLQELPHLTNPDEAREVVGEWPAYRVSSTHVMTMQHRMFDCYWQMRMPRLEFGSEASVALVAYLTANAEGGEVKAPSIKR